MPHSFDPTLKSDMQIRLEGDMVLFNDSPVSPSQRPCATHLLLFHIYEELKQLNEIGIPVGFLSKTIRDTGQQISDDICRKIDTEGERVFKALEVVQRVRERVSPSLDALDRATHPAREALPKAPWDKNPPLQPGRTKLPLEEALEIIEAQHKAMDQLSAWLIAADPDFRPTKAPFWSTVLWAVGFMKQYGKQS